MRPVLWTEIHISLKGDLRFCSIPDFCQLGSHRRTSQCCSKMNQSNQSTRPRRSSLTQHLQRILRIDGPGNRHCTGSQVLSDAGSTPTPQQRKSAQRAQAHPSSHNVNTEPSHVHTKKHISYSDTPLGSKPVLISEEQSESLPISPAYEIFRHELHTSSKPEETSNISDICVSPTRASNDTQRKERRATLRLDAERLELEKKLMKLEQADSTKDYSSLRREPRRLAKKQPFGSSSRASSVSADESRTTKRFSSIFSSSRRSSRSRSRSSSFNEGDKVSPRHHSVGPGEISKPSPGAQPTTPSLSMTLPERFGTAISKELAVQSNPLLPNYTPSSQPQKPSNSDVATTAVNGPGSSNDLNKDERDTSHRPGPRKLGQEATEEAISISISDVQGPDPPAELDRLSFAAALNLGQRASDKTQPLGRLSQPAPPQNAASRVENSCELGTVGPKRAPASNIPSNTNYPKVRNSLTAFQTATPRRAPIRNPPGKIQGRHRGFTSSPLSGFPRTNSTTLSSPDAVPAELKSAGFDGICRTEPSASSKITVPLNTNIPYSVSSLRLSSGNDREDVQASSGPFEVANKYKGVPRNRLVNDPRLKKNKSRPCFSQTIPNSRSKGLPVLSHISDQGVQHATDPEKLLYYESPNGAFTNDSHSLPSRPTSLGKRSTAQTTSERKEISPYRRIPDPRSREMSSPRSDPTNVLDHKLGQSVVSLSTSTSHEPESEEYNTADEAASSVSESRGECIPAKHLENFSASTGVSNSSNKEMSSELHRASQAVDPNRAALQLRQAVESAKKLQQDQLVAKLFVICCHCKFWHDMPPEMYARLAFPTKSSAHTGHSHPIPLIPKSMPNDQASAKTTAGALLGPSVQLSATRQESTSALRPMAQLPGPVVRCCWCEHHMSRVCCQGWTTIVHLRERHH
ncbi:uncharacterized protein BDW43DRAFT_230728 [Aspergillus alliaceus]|uniref:uncharacterized protein n=1 Tax=Petromyces alliaceus TaxID=209559 RepID=UPI0012A428C8|nr:uncharacterized protein BDW43DRAFT_230728 [Aspergillus alliaceus]KAB8228093.1 hypothetical protein BDW43DRAFT_230728 [Aspergillus alliaceus]